MDVDDLLRRRGVEGHDLLAPRRGHGAGVVLQKHVSIRSLL